AVEQQLVADVPVGVFLSGGLDSSTLVAAARARGARKLTTISFGFEDGLNELPFARDVARKYATDHLELHEKSVDVAELLLKMADVFDEPFGDSSNVPAFLIAREARKHLKVVIGGEGSDELLAGYRGWYRPLRGAKGLFNLARHQSLLRAHLERTSYFKSADVAALGLRPPALAEEKDRGRTALERVLLWDVQNYLPGDILVKGDRAAMASSLEVRAPFLDRPFAEFCLKLPLGYKMDAKSDKKILRDAFSSDWPESVRGRGKQGFGAPVEKWLKGDGVRALKREYLENPSRRIYSHIPFEAACSFVERDNYQTWALLALSLWFENHGRTATR
ncbi:MAG: asparagine synthase C-terminal domain-containing protein, partial [Deltaproteobacteria bacterium]|nr:asparagine synthase C-terminal domain-containing protein [Deltaproteobacteria bacterium]